MIPQSQGDAGDTGQPPGSGDPSGSGDTGAPPEDVDGQVGERGDLEDEAEQPEGTGSAGEESPTEGEMTEEEARRLLDGVEEGTPRVGRSRTPPGGKNW